MDLLLLSLQDFLTIFLGIIIQAIPFILFGVFVSAILAHFVKEEKLLKLIPRNRFGGIFVACCIGFLFPVCECGNVPVARRLIRKGVPPYVALTFLFAAPALNPIVIFATWAAFPTHVEIVILRTVLTFVIAAIIGWVLSYHPEQKEMLSEVPASNEQVAACDHHPSHHATARFKFFAFLQTVAVEFAEMLAVLVFGAFMASFIQIIIPREIIFEVGKGPILSVVAMVVLAFILSVCSNVDAFIALSYSHIFTTGSLLAFLVFGPMVDLKSVFMLKSVFRWKIVVIASMLALFLTLIATIFMNIYIY